MATYNGEKYLHEQLDSIWSQSVKPDEIIISDDHSSDHTIEIIRRFMGETKAPVTLLQNKENIGFIKNFHQALTSIHGDIVFLSDQDDIWLPGRISECLEIFDLNPSVLSLNCGIVVSADTKNVNITNSSKRLSNVSLKSFLRHPKYPGMAMAVRKQLVAQMLSSGNTVAVHDWLLNYYAAKGNGMYYYGKPLVIYRQHGANVIGSAQRNNISATVENRTNLLDGIVHSLKSVQLEDGVPHKYITELIKRNQMRIILLNEHSFFRLFLYDTINIKYISFRSLLGDLFTLSKF